MRYGLASGHRQQFKHCLRYHQLIASLLSAMTQGAFFQVEGELEPSHTFVYHCRRRLTTDATSRLHSRGGLGGRTACIWCIITQANLTELQERLKEALRCLGKRIRR